MDNPKFSFSFVCLNDTIDGVSKSNPTKYSRATDKLAKAIKTKACLILRFEQFQQLIIMVEKFQWSDWWNGVQVNF